MTPGTGTPGTGTPGTGTPGTRPLLGSTTWLGVLLALVLASGLLAVSAPAAVAAAGSCDGAPSTDLGTARTNYDNACSDTWDSQSGFHRCDWLSLGWVCTGPGTDSEPTDEPQPSAQPEDSTTQALRSVANLRLQENYLAQPAGPFLASKTLSWRDNGNHADGYNILRNGDYWTTLDSSRAFGDFYAVTDKEFDKTVVYEVQAYRHTATGHEWGPRAGVAVVRSRKSTAAAPATGNSPVSDISAERANAANEAAAAARTEADQQYDQFIQALIPQTNVEITLEVGYPDGAAFGISLTADFDLNQLVTEGTEAWNADDVADELEDAAAAAEYTHEQCLAGADSCPFVLIVRPPGGDDECSDGCPPDITRPPGCTNNNGSNGGKGDGGDAYSGDPAYGSSDGC